MFKVGEKVRVKSLDEMKDADLLHKDGNLYVNEDTKFVLLGNFPFFDSITNITTIDDKDPDVPYFLANGIWVPEFMIESKEPKPEPIIEEEIVNVEEVEEKPKEWINKFTGKPFGALMIKLINLDEKVAEFSSTRFSRLRRQELVYIANLLMENGAEDVAIDVMNVRDLAKYCYNETLNL